jgi:hypothetical protein
MTSRIKSTPINLTVRYAALFGSIGPSRPPLDNP